MAGPLSARPGRDASPEERGRWWVDVALTEAVRARALTWPALLASLLVVHVAGALWQHQHGRGLLSALIGNRAPRPLIRMGGLTGTALQDAQPWRLVTSLFLHGDGLHLLLNGLAMAGLGSLCEALFGSGRLLWMFLVTGVAGGLLSWSGGDLTVSIGASGALFGWMGAALGFGLRWRAVLPADLSAVLWRRLLPWALLNLGVGLAIPFLDHRAHLGGLLAGLVLGAFGGNRIVPGRESGRAWSLTRTALCALSLAWAALALAGR